MFYYTTYLYKQGDQEKKRPALVYGFFSVTRKSLVLQAFLLVNVSTLNCYLWSYVKTLIHRKAYNTKDPLVFNKKWKFCIRAPARMKNACSRLRSRLEAVIAAEGYFFKWYLHKQVLMLYCYALFIIFVFFTFIQRQILVQI